MRAMAEIHRALALALAKERDLKVLAQLSKCAATLVMNAPYPAIPNGLVRGLLESEFSVVQQVDRRKGSTALCACIAAMTSLFNAADIPEDCIRQIVQQHRVLDYFISELQSSSSWPLAETLSLLGTLVNRIPSTVEPYQGTMWILISQFSKDRDPVIRLHSLRLLGRLLVADSSDGKQGDTKLIDDQLALDVIASCWNDSFHSVRAECVSCVGDFPLRLWASLDDQQVDNLVDRMLKALQDPASGVRMTTLRALFPLSLRLNRPTNAVLESISHVAENDVAVAVKAKALQSLGSIVMHSSAFISRRTLSQSLRAAREGMLGHEPMRNSAIRALGALGHYVERWRETNSSRASVLMDIIESLLKVPIIHGDQKDFARNALLALKGTEDALMINSSRSLLQPDDEIAISTTLATSLQAILDKTLDFRLLCTALKVTRLGLGMAILSSPYWSLMVQAFRLIGSNNNLDFHIEWKSCWMELVVLLSDLAERDPDALQLTEVLTYRETALMMVAVLGQSSFLSSEDLAVIEGVLPSEFDRGMTWEQRRSSVSMLARLVSRFSDESVHWETLKRWIGSLVWESDGFKSPTSV
uniref:DUF4042 domain-containing protein n=1 Tax=Compsopogon caeruleus TaxID=31354 RepID=A0A6T6CI85_9RHOD|mmetsp:Transcript_5194/g.10581  ORF Transcript_5194/g.10581 Transcript_5194/m.10581 type:complete len:587 (+) Transcript_5194:3-1763(+)